LKIHNEHDFDVTVSGTFYRRASFINGALGALQSVSKLCLFAGVLWSSIYGIRCRPADM